MLRLASVPEPGESGNSIFALRCDNCGAVEPMTVDPNDDAGRQAWLTSMENKGWVHPDPETYCPECAQTHKEA